MNGGELLPGLLNIEVIVLGETGEHIVVKQCASIPAADSAFGDGRLRVLDHSIYIKKLVHAQAVAGGAGTSWVVKGKQSWLKFIEAVVAHRAGKFGTKYLIRCAAIHIAYAGQSLGEGQGGLKGFSQAQAYILFDLKAVNHHLNSMFFLFIQRRSLIQIADQAIDTGANKALAAQAVKQMQMLTFTILDHWCQQHQFAALWQRQYLIDHLAHGLSIECLTMVRAARFASSGK